MSTLQEISFLNYKIIFRNAVMKSYWLSWLNICKPGQRIFYVGIVDSQNSMANIYPIIKNQILWTVPYHDNEINISKELADYCYKVLAMKEFW